MFDLRSRIVCGHSGAFLGLLRRPVEERKMISWGFCREIRKGRGGEGRRIYLAGFVLCDFVLGMLFTFFAFAVGAAGFGNVDL